MSKNPEQKKLEAEARQAQLLWTLCVAVGVALMALYQLNLPRMPLSSTLGARTQELPAAVRTNQPLGAAAHPDRSSAAISEGRDTVYPN